MPGKKIIHLKSITEFHRSRGLEAPQHPLISIVNYADIQLSADTADVNWVCDFYSIAVKRNLNAKLHYGQQEYDFDEGVMFFIAPGQVYGVSFEGAATWERSGWILLLHPDFLWNTSLGTSIKGYEYFGYSANEALHLSEKEEATMKGIIDNIRQEYHNNLDRFSQNIIIAQIETLLFYADRFYQRQFITRKISNHKILSRFEIILNEYFSSCKQINSGLPSVQYIADSLNVSPNYLSGLLKSLTGETTQQHIHNYLIEKAKERLSATTLSVSEIAYELGFEHPQSFSKLFKLKTDVSPLEFRAKFN
ncbi:AraC family transcriptional regulator [Arcticibacter tournemirensis]|uniref:Helix-turn-helix transcriptional regulator n=1 Tax=Arcticibacter tournemirensis TaxID=699437 RepID=A0A5M9HBL8_9SPHI|nr:helix-turn-helix transcriptional regulator [Arcticibacter tournemirensis]KAA8484090.1 helix-turn-helix transcriptional regulator [Arcticibacter tournemirensis]TQM51826.1 AraC family transcriptional regulator [Arcticibacter tournemirensis]